MCREAISILSDVYRPDAEQLEKRADQATKILARLRDRLISEIRTFPAAAEGPDMHKALLDVNTAISLLIGVDYPAVGVSRELAESAEEILSSLALHELRDR